MALNDCASLGYVYEKNFCLPVGVDVKQDEFTFDSSWIAGAFFLGLLLGAGIVLLLAKPFLAAWKKRKDQGSLLQSPHLRANIAEAEVANGWINKDTLQKTPKVKEERKFFKVRFWRRKRSPVTLTGEENEAKEEDVDPAVAHGMVDIMLQTSRSESEVEMAEQDMAEVVSMERWKEEEKSTLMLHILASLLRMKMKERAITKNFLHNFIKKTEEDMKDMGKMIDREREEDEEKLRNDPKLNKDTQMLETEMQKLQTYYSNKQSKLQRDFRNKIRQDLLRLSGMSETEINDIMTKLINNMAVLEEQIGLEQARQRRALEQRLARRRQVLEYMEMEAEEGEQDMEARVEAFRNLLPAHMEGNKVERHTDDTINEFANELHIIRKFHAKEYDVLSKERCDFLLNYRLNSFSKLVKKQDKEKAEVLQTEGQTTNTIDFIKRYHDLMTKHHMEMEVLCEELDRKEVQEMHKLKQDLAKKENGDMDKKTEEVAEKLKNEISLTSSGALKIIKLHKAEMENYIAGKQKEKQAMLARLQERLQQRLDIADKNEARDQKEQEILKEEQMATLIKVWTTSMDLTEEDKNQVLKEHEQNMQALSNQLLCSKLRQQKSLEIKLNQRKVQLEKLKLKTRDLQRSTELKKKEKDDLLAKLSADIAKEERLFEEARQAAVAELRRQLAKETEEALKLQDEEISLLIGRLQVSGARRKAVLEKQDATAKQLQEVLEKRLASGEPLPSSETDQILKEHNSYVAHLNEQLQRRREKEERIIKEKLSAKKRRLEQEIETDLEERAQTEYTEQQKIGAGYASLTLMQLFLEQKHAKAMQELNTEMLAELEKCRSDLNLELELELQKELEVQKQDLLTQMAAVSQMSQKDLQDAVSAVASGNADNRRAQLLAKDLRDSMLKRRPLTDDYADDHGNT